MKPNHDHSLIPIRSRELTAPQIGGSRILGEMVEGTLALARVAALTDIALDALVLEARRIQIRNAGMSSENIRAFGLFLQAARAGHPEAQREVSNCFSRGIGVAKDSAEWSRWLTLAAENGSAAAQCQLGVLCTHFDDCKSAEWYKKAAESGYDYARMMLATCYHFGKGVREDYCRAYAWYQLAAESELGDTAMTTAGVVLNLKEQAAAIADLMSPGQLEKALELYQDYKRKYSSRC